MTEAPRPPPHLTHLAEAAQREAALRQENARLGRIEEAALELWDAQNAWERHRDVPLLAIRLADAWLRLSICLIHPHKEAPAHE